MKANFLHIALVDKFIPPYIEFVRENFCLTDHEFSLFSLTNGPQIQSSEGVFLAEKSIFGRIKAYLKLIIKMHQTKKILLHGMFDIGLVVILFFLPWLHKKCCWVMWGGDLYLYKTSKKDWKWHINEFFRRPVIRRLGFFTTTVPGDYELAVKWYGTSAKYTECLMYMSHVCRDSNVANVNAVAIETKTIRIQIGNSADPTNNHFEMIDKLAMFKNQEIKVYAPLSYGNGLYRDKVIKYGKEKLGEKFIPMTTFMSFNEYNEYMKTIDIAVFNHNRQQAMGNIIGLLSLGKKVYLRNDITPFKYFKDRGVKVFSVNSNIDILPLKVSDRVGNIGKMNVFFTKKRLIKTWKDVFAAM